MPTDRPLPRQVKIMDSATLLKLEQRAAALRLNQRLPPAWLSNHLAPSGSHYLWPAIWHRLVHRPEIPPHLRCELLLHLRGGEHVLSLLDVLLPDFEPLPSVRSRDECLMVDQWMRSARTVKEWDEGRSGRLVQ
jgi:hypothetical protein